MALSGCLLLLLCIIAILEIVTDWVILAGIQLIWCTVTAVISGFVMAVKTFHLLTFLTLIKWAIQSANTAHQHQNGSAHHVVQLSLLIFPQPHFPLSTPRLIEAAL